MARYLLCDESQEPGSKRRPAIYDTAALPNELSWLGVSYTIMTTFGSLGFGVGGIIEQ